MSKANNDPIKLSLEGDHRQSRRSLTCQEPVMIQVTNPKTVTRRGSSSIIRTINLSGAIMEHALGQGKCLMQHPRILHQIF